MNNDENIDVIVSFSQESVVSTSAWIKGISLSVLASIIGGASKLAIRKSWVIEQQFQQQQQQEQELNQQQPFAIGTTQSISENVIPLSINESDTGTTGTHTQYSQIRSAVDVEDDDDVHPFGTVRHDIIPTIGEDHYSSSSHNYIESSPNRYIPILLRTFGMMGMTIFNPLCSVLAMNYASPSILAPFSGLTLVWIVLFSETLVGEKPSVRQIIAAAMIVIGEVVIAIFGDHTNDEGISVAEVVESYHDISFICFIVAMCVWMIFLLYYMCTSAKVNTSPTFQRFAWGVVGGSITGFQNFLKDSLTILKSSKINNEDGSNSEFPYLLFIFMFGMAIISALSGLIILTLCMKRYDVTYSASMFVGSFCISASIMSAIHYDTFSHLNDTINYIGYPIGLIILLYGVYMLLISTSATSGNEPFHQSNAAPLTIEERFRHTEGRVLT